MNVFVKQPSHKFTKGKGFSLVELSIVLVILGLLTGGILTGQSLIRAAELRSVITEFQQYQTAVNTFKQKYFALPGDMPNATQFWGKLNSACPTHEGTANSTGVCNGNGNQFIDYIDAAPFFEHHMLWKHLALAGLINGTYTGLSQSGHSWWSKSGVNVPSSKISGSGWIAFTTGPSYDPAYAVNLASWWFTIDMPHSFSFGEPFDYGANAILTVEEIWSIDKKIDDSKPAQGKVLCISFVQCANTDTNGITADYIFTNNIAASIVFREAY